MSRIKHPKVGDLVRIYPKNIYGIIKEIYDIKSSFHDDREKIKTFYQVQPVNGSYDCLEVNYEEIEAIYR